MVTPHSSPRAASFARPFSLLALLAFASCGGGGGGGAGSRSASFFVTDVKYGRLIDEGSGPRLVSPLTTVSVDPVTGKVVPGSLQALASGVDVNALQTLGMGPDYLPRVVPRNGVLQLEFSAPIDPASIAADVLDADGSVLIDGSIEVRTETGRGVPVTLTQVAPNVVWVDPITATTIGFPPSPVDFGPSGDARADATGYLKLILPNGGPAVLVSKRGALLGSRADHLGDVASPVGINPGNRVLDFIAQNQLIPTGETFNGFLPDIAPPRVIRNYAYSKALDFAGGDGGSATQVVDATAKFSTLARNGLGEWAAAALTLRPGRSDQETHVVLSNSATVVTIVDSFTLPPQDGDTYQLVRAEFFEPDLNHPIDPATFDPNDPENANDAQFVNFVEGWEIDASGAAVNGPLSLRDPLPPFSELRVRFNEPMSSDALSAYENFQVRYDPDQGPGSEILSQITLDPTQTVVALRPALEDQTTGTFQIVGWGKGVKTLRFSVTTVPKPTYLQQVLASDQVQAFLDQGFRGVNDLGGQPLAFPDSLFDVNHPAVIYSLPFTSDESKSTQSPPPVLQSFGVIVHRMQGRPITGVDPTTGLAGVKFVDQPNYYSPIADVNLQTNGFLAGSPVVYLTKIHDDYFPPPHGQFAAFALGTGIPLASYSTQAGPQPHDGARFQTVYRDIDASPSRDALAGTLLDLYRVSWAPIGGSVTTDNYQDISIHCAHSPVRPITSAVGGALLDATSGLVEPFDWASWFSLLDNNPAPLCPGPCTNAEAPNYWDTLVTCVPPGTTYKITQANLFAPPFDGHPYCPWPTFTTPFQYNNGDLPAAEVALRKDTNTNHHCGTSGQAWRDTRTYNTDPTLDNSGGDSLMLEIRIRPQSTNISRANGFTFAAGTLLSYAPYFRMFSVGSPGKSMNPDDIANSKYARCAWGDTSGTLSQGDNSRYFVALDYVKTTSVITSPFVRVYPINTTSPDFFAPIFLPSVADQPAGTSVKLEYAGANNTKGNGSTGFSTDVNVADGKANIAFRATLVGNVTTLLLPNFDLIEIPYLKPNGD